MAAVTVTLACVAPVLAGCGAAAAHHSAHRPIAPARASRTPRAEADTAAALLSVARRFNADYAANRDGAVYARWDARSQAIIGRAAYIARHRECPTNPGPADVQSAQRVGSWWTVRYTISGSALTDYWRYVDGRWRFDLVRSNPQAVALYRLPARRYLAAVGCAPAG